MQDVIATGVVRDKERFSDAVGNLVGSSDQYTQLEKNWYMRGLLGTGRFSDIGEALKEAELFFDQFLAAFSDDALVIRMLKNKVMDDVEESSELLFSAVLCQRPGLVKYFAQNNPSDLNRIFENDQVCTDNRTALMYASQSGYSRVVEALLENGAQVDFVSDHPEHPQNNITPLLYAVGKYGKAHIPTMELLIAYGANKDIADSDGNNVMAYAKRYHATKDGVLDFLISNGFPDGKWKEKTIRPEPGLLAGDNSVTVRSIGGAGGGGSSILSVGDVTAFSGQPGWREREEGRGRDRDRDRDRGGR